MMRLEVVLKLEGQALLVLQVLARRVFRSFLTIAATPTTLELSATTKPNFLLNKIGIT